MKAAILILAHKNIEQVRRLVNHLKSDFEIYLHFDQRITHDLIDEDHVHILKKRYSAYWGSDRAIKAMLELLKEANKDNCDYYMFISGQDLPLMSNKAIKDKLGDHHTSYMQHTKLPRADWDHNGGLDRLNLYWDTKYESNASKLKFIALLPLKVSGLLFRKLQILTGLRRKINFEAYGGSIWLNLTKGAVAYILDFTAKNPWYVERFKYTRATDELFFHSILMAFDYPAKDSIVNDDMRYTDWTTGPGYPRTLTMDDYEKCIHSGKLFGRKFDEQADGSVIDTILSVTSH